jgi:hypothetical protein
VSTHQHIAQRAIHVPVRQICQVLRVAPAAYYAWQRRRQESVFEPAWQVAVREAVANYSQRYGTRRLRAEAQAQGHAKSFWSRFLISHRVRAQQPRSFAPHITESDPAVRAAPNLLLSQLAPTATSRIRPGKAADCTCRMVGPVSTQNSELGRARHDARRPSQRVPATGLCRAPRTRWARRALRPRQPTL